MFRTTHLFRLTKTKPFDCVINCLLSIISLFTPNSRRNQLRWLIGPLFLLVGGSLLADVSRTPCGGGVPEDPFTPNSHNKSFVSEQTVCSQPLSFWTFSSMDLQAISIDYCNVIMVSHDSFDSIGIDCSFLP